MTILIPILLIAVCCIIIWRASDGFEAASEYLGRNLSDGVRGATINAIGSSMPELFTTLFFLFVMHDRDGFAGGIGTTAGSAIFNGMIIPAVVILVVVFKGMASSVKVSRKVLMRDGIALLLCELILIFLIGGKSLTWVHGLILMAMYAVYAIYMLRTMTKGGGGDIEEEEEEDDEDGESKGILVSILTLDLENVFVRKGINASNAWAMLLVATAIIGSACFLLVISCEDLGEALDIPIYFVAVILASAATSVPDTILSMKDAKKGNYDDAVSNALGSNIFDVCFALGFPLFLYTIIYGPIDMSPETLVNVSELRILLFIFTLFAFFIYIGGKSMGKMSAVLLLLIYVAFTLYILGKAADNPIANSIAEILGNINHVIDSLRFWN